MNVINKFKCKNDSTLSKKSLKTKKKSKVKKYEIKPDLWRPDSGSTSHKLLIKKPEKQGMTSVRSVAELLKSTMYHFKKEDFLK